MFFFFLKYWCDFENISLIKNLKTDMKVMAGSLIKLVYFSRHENHSIDDERRKNVKARLGISNGNRRSYPILGGRLHFVKFETHKINECIDFISSKQLHRGGIIILVPLCNCINFTLDLFYSHYLFIYLLTCFFIFWSISHW